MRVLHIDNSHQIRELYKDMFTADKHSIKSVYSGIEGLELVVENDYDLILLDLYVSGYSTIQFLYDLKNKKASELKKVVVVTDLKLDENHIQEFLKFGIHSVETKPTNLDNIVNMQENLILN